MVFLSNKTIKNILSNYIPHEIIICVDQDPPWISNRAKDLIKKMGFFKVTLIEIRIPSYSIKFNISKIN